jgi:Zn ribbon nucleic-acid-binding protein
MTCVKDYTNIPQNLDTKDDIDYICGNRRNNMKKQTCPECGKGKMISHGGSHPECDYCGHHEYRLASENIKQDVRATEAHIKAMTHSPAAQIAIISKAQSLLLAKLGTARQDEYAFAVLTVAKNRIIHSN